MTDNGSPGRVRQVLDTLPALAIVSVAAAAATAAVGTALRRRDPGRAWNVLAGRRAGVESPTYLTDPDSQTISLVDGYQRTR
jgi:hypothetical protein